MAKILVIEDDKNISKILSYDLKNSGYEVEQAGDGQIALEFLENTRFDLVILDWMLPKYDGIEILKRMKRKPIVIMLTAKSEEYDMIEAFEMGVDDYVVKPFSPRVLLLKIKAHLKKRNYQINEFYDLKINVEKREIIQNNDKISLTKTEFELLMLLSSNLNKVLSRDMILNHIWGFDYDGDTRIVDVHISKLRSKIKSEYFIIEHSYGIGYILKDE